MNNCTELEKDQQVFILKSNIKTKNDFERLLKVFSRIEAIVRWSLDLDDRERVLKVIATDELTMDMITDLINLLGYQCSELDH